MRPKRILHNIGHIYARRYLREVVERQEGEIHRLLRANDRVEDANEELKTENRSLKRKFNKLLKAQGE